MKINNVQILFYFIILDDDRLLLQPAFKLQPHRLKLICNQ